MYKQLLEMKHSVYRLLAERNQQINLEYTEYKSKRNQKNKFELVKTWLYLLRLNIQYLGKKEKKSEIIIRDNKKTITKDEFTEKIKRGSYSAIMRKLMHYDVISFDIFDTLILRPFTNPEDLFLLLSSEYNFVNFSQLRKRAEKRARDFQEKNSIDGNREVTIFEIYKELSKETGIDIDKGAEREFLLEKKYCYANPYMKAIFDAVVQEGKIVVIVSNMYYPKEMLGELLEECGYSGYDKIYISCDYNLNKRNGKLFEVVLNEYRNKEIIHIGDNQEADIKGAEACGFDTLYYRINTKGKKDFRKNDNSYIIGSFYNAIVQNSYNNGYYINEYKDRQKKYYKYGFKYGGLMILGYVNFIHEYCSKNKIDKILFLSRDGEFLQKIYQKYYNDVSCDYVLWSRSASMRTMPHIYISDFFNHVVRRRVEFSKDSRVIDYLREMKMEFLENEISLNCDDVITNDNVEEFYLAILKCSVLIKERAKEIQEAVKLYIMPIIEEYHEIAIVDIGWRGSGAISLMKLINEIYGEKCNITALVAGNTLHKDSYDSSLVNDGKIVSYMFSEEKNMDLGVHFQKNAEKFMPIFEIFCASSCSPSFLGIKKEKDSYEFLFDKPETENYEIIREIHKGEEEFIAEYIKRSCDNKNLLRITGRDAYNAIIRAFNEPSLYEDFKNYTYPRNVGGVDNKEHIEKLAEVWKY